MLCEAKYWENELSIPTIERERRSNVEYEEKREAETGGSIKKGPFGKASNKAAERGTKKKK